MAKIHVWYKPSGEIVVVGDASGNDNCIPVTGENQSVLELDVDESEVSSLHQTHRVDPLRQTLVKVQPTDTTREP